LPLLDIHTIGAGGGSIAFTDAGGSLRVGPQSAGADPGPACYGKGHLPTVTDANLVLGRLIPDYFLGGQMHIYPFRANDALSNLGKEINLSPIEVAFGIIDVVNIQMERALRLISIERGYDPRQFCLFSFGEFTRCSSTARIPVLISNMLDPFSLGMLIWMYKIMLNN
jgi:N-methylhydantoinase A